MKEVDRVVEATVENALKLKAEWRAEVRRGDRAAADVPRLTDYATSWLRSRLPALKASTAATYADVLDAHVLPHLGEVIRIERAQWHGIVGRRKRGTCGRCR